MKRNIPKINILVVVALLIMCSVSFANDKNVNQCTPDETVYFSCSIKSKVVSLCGSSNLSGDDGYLVYRFGYPGKTLELVYPQDKMKPAEVFALYSSSYAKGSTTQISFENKRYTYTLYHEQNVWDVNGSGVAIEKDGKRIAHLKCDEKSVKVGNIGILSNIGLKKLEFKDLP
ncbi:MAG: hypothetical protein JW914_08655 [Syntrophaceae bacterium]|nr:hypothetical protein [Syntrophaceae bacterium]